MLSRATKPFLRVRTEFCTFLAEVCAFWMILVECFVFINSVSHCHNYYVNCWIVDTGCLRKTVHYLDGGGAARCRASTCKMRNTYKNSSVNVTQFRKLLLELIGQTGADLPSASASVGSPTVWSRLVRTHSAVLLHSFEATAVGVNSAKTGAWVNHACFLNRRRTFICTRDHRNMNHNIKKNTIQVARKGRLPFLAKGNICLSEKKLQKYLKITDSVQKIVNWQQIMDNEQRH